MIKHVHKAVDYLNTSKYFTGLMMIMLNIGSKYITVKLSKSQEAYVRNYILRELLIFSVCWMGTRDIYTSLVLTAVFFILTQHLFNEESKYCILPKKYREFHLFDTNQDGEISQQEINDAVNLLTKAKKQKSALHREKLYDYFQKNKV
jgi:hypothetical protein